MGSAISAFYYLRVFKWIWFNDSTYFHYKDIGDVLYPVTNNKHVSFVSSIIMGSSLFIIITFMIYPNWLLDLSLTTISSGLL
jgi:NADH:ubiquinone oxidoreductase subunit 2 (subunit N)